MFTEVGPSDQAFEEVPNPGIGMLLVGVTVTVHKSGPRLVTLAVAGIEVKVMSAVRLTDEFSVRVIPIPPAKAAGVRAAAAKEITKLRPSNPIVLGTVLIVIRLVIAQAFLSKTGL
jgi:hypothetical protein